MPTLSKSRQVSILADTVVSVKDFGAVGDGVTDDTAAIQAAIDYLAANGGGSVYVPANVYRVSQIVLKSYVSLIGCRAENGWARLITYENGSIIKSLNGSGLSPVKINHGASNWGLQNIIVDANKATQTFPGVHCVEHLRTAAGDSYGGLIEKCKFVNPTGYAAYFMRCRPLDIRDSFFMSGAAFIQCYDMNITGCSIDGTDSKHPSVLWDSCNSVQALNNLIWRGESVSAQVKQAATVDTVNDWLTVSNDSAFYDNQPVTIESSGSMPSMTLNGSATPIGWTNSFLVKKLGSNRIQLWKNNTNSTTGYSVLFSTAGSGVSLTSGARDIFCTYEGFNQKIAGNRIAGSPGGAFRSHRCSMVSYENNDSYLLNFDDKPDQDGLTLVGAQYHSITDSFVGDLDQDPSLDRLLSAIRILDDTSTTPTIVSKGNVIGNNQYNVTQGLYVEDLSSASYEERNIIVGLDNLFGGLSSGVKRISSQAHRSEPLRYYYCAGATSAQSIANTTATDIAWTAVTYGNPRSVTDASTITFPMTAGSLIQVAGSLGFTRVAGTYYILVYVFINSVAHRFYFEQEVTKTDPGLIVVPFSVLTPVSTNAVVTVQVFQNSGGAMTLRQNIDTTRLTVQKIADYQYA